MVPCHRIAPVYYSPYVLPAHLRMYADIPVPGKNTLHALRVTRPFWRAECFTAVKWQSKVKSYKAFQMLQKC